VGEKWFKKLLRGRMLVALLLVLQLIFVIYLVANGSQQSLFISWTLTVISFLVALNIVTQKNKGAYKLTWVFLILLVPVFGGLFYLLFKFQTSSKKFHRELEQVERGSKPSFLLPGNRFNEACKETPSHIPQIRYLQKFAGFPVYRHTRTKYLTPGEEKFSALLEELEKAERYIFLEYFIIHDGIMWGSVLEILKEKVKQGVDVRLIYDDMGCLFLLPKDYPEQLKKWGIKCAVFNPFRPVLSAIQNNRDHRKIAVIDGKVAFTGGINLADEYINVIEKYGHWKDASIMIEGEAAWSFTVMFLQMWSICKNIKENYHHYYPWKYEHCEIENDGLVQPYADSPMDHENVGEHVYLQMINNAKDYVYINTPCLIIDDSMVSALTLAAKSGVDVRIVTPHRWDKRIVHFTTRSYYRELISAGIKIYEYTEGFMHSKTFVSDDSTATVGTTNLDFRSLYLHFECGVWLYESTAVMEVKNDFLKTLEISQKIRKQDCKGNVMSNFLQDVFRLFAPLM